MRRRPRLAPPLTAVLGFASVSNSVRHAREIVDHVLEFLRGHPVAVVTQHEVEVL